MSITPCFLLFLLFLTLHASTARRLRKVYTENTLDKKFHLSVKGDTKTGFRRIAVAVPEAKSHAKGDDGDVDHKSKVSVSWRVPHEKRAGEHPAFNLDYSPPKTHPPSHY